MKETMRFIDYREIRKLFDEQYKQTKRLIQEGETHLDNWAEGFSEADHIIRDLPDVDAVEVVRCKDCKYFVPKHILLKDGSTRDYTEEERKLPFGVTGDVGINCGSICMLHDYWAENRFPVYVNENDFCSYGERKEETP